MINPKGITTPRSLYKALAWKILLCSSTEASMIGAILAYSMTKPPQKRQGMADQLLFWCYQIKDAVKKGIQV